MRTRRHRIAGSLFLSAVGLCLSLIVTSCVAFAPSSAGSRPVGSAERTTAVRTYHAGETWVVPGEWEFTVDSIRATRLRASIAKGYRPAKQVLVVTYSYKNIRPAGGKPLAFSKANFYMTDVRHTTFADGSHYTLHLPGMNRGLLVKPGRSVEGAAWPYAFYHIEAAEVEFHVAAYDSNRKLYEAEYLVRVRSETAGD